MSRASSYFMLALCVIVVLYGTGDGAVSPHGNQPFPALIALGDSVLDTGNNNGRITTTKCDFPPYGRDFPGGKATGRFSNGKVFSDLIAENLGIKSSLPAFLDPNLRSEDLASGVCFASGGTGLDSLTAKLQNVIPTKDQLNLFKQYVKKLERSVGTKKAEGIISESLYLVSLGNNDIQITYDTILRKTDINIYTTQLVAWASTFIKDMYGLGARKFAYLSTLPLGCLPVARTQAGGKCAEWLTQAAILFNSKMETEIINLKSFLSESNMVFIDIYNPLIDLIQNPDKYGFDDSTNGCCGTGKIEVSYLCNRFDSLTCSVTSSHVFWDSIHPSERSYKLIIPQALDQIRNNFLLYTTNTTLKQKRP